jgi:hypothetical protein
MQATIRSYDDADGGSAFLDDGTVVPLPPHALASSHFRFVRPGQRVRLVHDEDGAVIGIDLP